MKIFDWFVFGQNMRGVCLGGVFGVLLLFGGLVGKGVAEDGWRAPANDERITLENEAARVVIWPQVGGTITEYINKKTGTNYVAGEVVPEQSSYGWRDVSRIGWSDPEAEWFSGRPYEVRKLETPEAVGVELRSRAGGLESTRKILLDRSSAKLRVTAGQRNISDEKRRLYLRWHPHMMVGDPYAENSAIFFPDENGNLRKIKVGIGWDDQFLNPGGFAMAANWKTGEGLWMTYESEKVPYLATWTDYKKSKRHPLRGAFTVEPQPPPVLKAPGEGVELTYEYFPFTNETPEKDFPVDLVGGEEAAAARRFIKLVRPHLEALGPYTMVPEPPFSAKAAIEQNRFSYMHARRDRMALRDWGMADALFSMPGKQDIPARIRFYGRLFPGAKPPAPLRYVFFVEDGYGKRVIEETKSLSLSPDAAEVDERVEVPLTKLPDGHYRVGVEVFEADNPVAIHRVEEDRSLVGNKWSEMTAQPRPSTLNERPFVTALRKADFRNDSLKDLDIPVGVEDASGVARTDWPVTVGVPFSRGRVQPATPLTLLDPKGRETGFDSRVASTWDDGSVRWLLLDFNANVPADGHVFYRLKSGKPKMEMPPQLLKSEGDTLTFNNGAQSWSWHSSPDAEALGPLRGDGLWWTNQKGVRYRFRLEGEGSGLVIERNGSYRAVVRATGWYYAEGIEKPVARGILRFEGYRGQPQLKIEHNVMFAGDPWSERLVSFGLKLPLPEAAEGAVEIGVDGATKKVSPPFALRQLQHDTCVIQPKDGKPINARRASGVFAFPQKSGARTVAFRNFWRMNPKEVRMDTPEAVTFFYWPEGGDAMSFLPREDGWIPSSSSAEGIAVGAGRTHEFYLMDGPARNLQETDRLFDEPVAALVPPRYLAETGAMMHLQPYDPDRWPEIENILSQAFDSYLLNQRLWGWYGEWAYGAIPNAFIPEEYRWADFGRYGHILNEQDIVQTAWLAYLRSGDRKYLKFAEANTRQLMEVSTINWSDVWPEFVGLSHRHHECLWLGGGDYGHTMLDPFLEMYHVLGYEPAREAALATAEAMKKQRTGTWRYISNPLAGLSRMYLETQDPSYKKEADRIWKDLCFPDQNDWWVSDHGDRAVMYYSQVNPECKKLWLEETGKQKKGLQSPLTKFGGMDALSALYLETKDPKHAKAVAEGFRKWIAEAGKKATDDPLRLQIAPNTQHVLAALRQMCYAGSTLEAAKQLSQKDQPAGDPAPNP